MCIIIYGYMVPFPTYKNCNVHSSLFEEYGADNDTHWDILAYKHHVSETEMSQQLLDEMP